MWRGFAAFSLKRKEVHARMKFVRIRGRSSLGDVMFASLPPPFGRCLFTQKRLREEILFRSHPFVCFGVEVLLYVSGARPMLLDIA